MWRILHDNAAHKRHLSDDASGGVALPWVRRLAVAVAEGGHLSALDGLDETELLAVLDCLSEVSPARSAA